jgi:hypothetical protein
LTVAAERAANRFDVSTVLRGKTESYRGIAHQRADRRSSFVIIQ